MSLIVRPPGNDRADLPLISLMPGHNLSQNRQSLELDSRLTAAASTRLSSRGRKIKICRSQSARRSAAKDRALNSSGTRMQGTLLFSRPRTNANQAFCVSDGPIKLTGPRFPSASGFRIRRSAGSFSVWAKQIKFAQTSYMISSLSTIKIIHGLFQFLAKQHLHCVGRLVQGFIHKFAL